MIELKGKIEPGTQICAEIIGTGPRGYTPQRGVDYWTPAEVEEIVNVPKRAEEERQAAELEREKFFGSVEGEITELKTDKLDKSPTEWPTWSGEEQRMARARIGADATERKLDYLWKLNQGISYQFESDDAESYCKTAHSGAKLASVEVIGGHTEVVGGELVSAQVECIVEHGRNLFDIRIDSETEYTTITVDIREPLYIKIYPHNISVLKSIWRVRIDTKLGDMYYVYDDNKNCKVIGTESNPIVEITYRATYITDGYYDVQVEKNSDEPAEFSPYHQNTYAIGNSVRELPGYGWSAGNVYNSIERTETGWQYVQRVGSRDYQDGDTVTDGVTTYYALDNPVITDITDLMADFPAYFEVEAGCTMTFYNTAKLPVPSTEKYLISLAEVNQ